MVADPEIQTSLHQWLQNDGFQPIAILCSEALQYVPWEDLRWGLKARTTEDL